MRHEIVDKRTINKISHIIMNKYTHKIYMDIKSHIQYSSELLNLEESIVSETYFSIRENTTPFEKIK